MREIREEDSHNIQLSETLTYRGLISHQLRVSDPYNTHKLHFFLSVSSKVDFALFVHLECHCPVLVDTNFNENLCVGVPGFS